MLLCYIISGRYLLCTMLSSNIYVSIIIHTGRTVYIIYDLDDLLASFPSKSFYLEMTLLRFRIWSQDIIYYIYWDILLT